MESVRKPSNEIQLIGKSLIYIGLVGFVYFFSTTKRVIDINIYHYALIAILGWFITQLKNWAWKVAIVLFVIYAVSELFGILILTVASFRVKVPLHSFVGEIGLLSFYSIFSALLLKRSVKCQFDHPKNFKP